MKPMHKSVLIFAVLIVVLGVFSDRLASGLTVKEEEDLSREVMATILRYYPMVDDPVVVEYINTLGNKLVAYLPEKLFQYHFYVVKTDSYNAFATPAGYIFVNSGLLLAMENEDELAGILAHEIAHVYCRHISQKIERSKKINMATLAGMAAGILLGATAGGEAGQAVTMGSAAAGQSASLAYSRGDEVQADQLGLVYLTKAGYNAEGLLEVLKKIRSKQWYGSDVLPTYLSTHPAVEDRIAYIDSWIAGQGKDFKSHTRVKSMEFERVHTLMLTRYGDEDTVLADLRAAVSAHPDEPLAHYRYGLILARVGRRDEAIDQIKIALEKRAFDPYILNDLGRIYFLDGQYQKALPILESVFSMKPDDADCRLFLGRTQMELGQLKQASDHFHALVKKFPNYKQGYYFLGHSLGKQGNMADAYYYLGLFYLQDRDLKAAAIHLERALKYTDDADRRKEIQNLLAKLNKAKEKKKK
ncbi:MAG: M48 family metalloprotease [Desulfobacteraceae bacterium]